MVPPQIAAFSPDGLLAAMPGYASGLGLAAKLVSIFPDNAAPLPTHQALVALFDESTGAPLAVMGGTYLTAIRTAMTAAIAARALARPPGRSLAIVGAGVQAAAHLVAFTHLLPPADIRIASRQVGKAAALAATHANAVAVPSVKAAVTGADIVCCCTAAADPVLDGSWIGPGVHVSSVGTGAELPSG
jgi:ornithine cyclodeaminase/alanine dehydrogenase-like protein (mu-crystallin family)